jgi:hypothetical protein
MDEFDPSHATFQRHASIIRGFPIQLNISIWEGKKVYDSTDTASVAQRPANINHILALLVSRLSQLTLDTHTNETIGVIRAKIAKEMNQPPSRVRLIANTKELTADNDVASKFHMTTGTTVVAMSGAVKEAAPVWKSEPASHSSHRY